MLTRILRLHFTSRMLAFSIFELTILLSPRPWAAEQAPVLHQVAPGVYVALQPFANRFNDSNSTIIIGEDSVIVVDTQSALTTTRGILQQIRKLTSKPVLYVVNTHWHGDHVLGNQVYREAFPAVQYIAQEKTREDMAIRATAELREQVANLPGQIERYRKMISAGQAADGKPLTATERNLVQMRVDIFSRQLPDLQQTHIVIPDITFGDSLTIYGGGREVRLMHFSGHTRGDTAVFLPAEKILISGDLLDDMPYTGDGSPAMLVRTLHEFDRLDFGIIIPGHGDIKHGREHLRKITGLFESIVSQVGEAARSGLSLEDTKKKVNVEAFRSAVTGGEEHAARAFDAWVPVAIERAYQDRKRGPIS